MLSLSTIVGAAALIYPIAESLIHEVNSTKAAKLRSELNMILAKNNLKINQLRSELERRGLSYNKLMDALSTVSPVGRAAKVKQKAEHEYAQSTKDINTQINNLTNKNEQISAIYNQDIDNLDNKGPLKTIIGDVIN